MPDPAREAKITAVIGCNTGQGLSALSRLAVSAAAPFAAPE